MRKKQLDMEGGVSTLGLTKPGQQLGFDLIVAYGSTTHSPLLCTAGQGGADTLRCRNCPLSLPLDGLTPKALKARCPAARGGGSSRSPDAVRLAWPMAMAGRFS